MCLYMYVCVFVNFQVEDAATQFGAGLVQLGIETGQDVFVGIYSRNCTEVRVSDRPRVVMVTDCAPSLQWVVAEQSCNYYSRVLVPLYDTLGSEAVAYIINQS